MTIKPTQARALVLAVLAAIGIGLVIARGASAAPANGTVIRDAVASMSDVNEVPCVVRRRCNSW